MPLATTDQLPLPGRSRRDDRLDFWRGLCLIDMVLVHLVSQGMQFGPVGHAFFTEYTRFAAGGYVMLSGMTIGFIYLPRAMDPNRRWSAYFALLRRAAYIYWISVAVAMGQLILCPMRGEPMPPLLKTLGETLVFRQGYDLLPFYVMMLAFSPIILECIRQRLTWLIFAASLAYFAWGHHDEEFKAHSFSITTTFFWILWQLPFVTGVVAGTWLSRYDQFKTRTKLLAAGSFWAMSILLFFGAYASHFGLTFSIPGLTFWKNPLTFGEYLRYLGLVGAILATTDLAWRWLRGSGVMRFVARMGRRSLAMYVAQIFLVGQIDRLNDAAAAAWPVWGLQFVFMALAIVLLWALAWVMDAMASQSRRSPAPVSPIVTSFNLSPTE